MALTRVIIDAPALLNLTKYCQEAHAKLGVSVKQGESDGTQSVFKGLVMGVLNKELDEVNLFITQAQVQQMDASGRVLAMPNMPGQASNEVGFFVCSMLGLAFSQANL